MNLDWTFSKPEPSDRVFCHVPEGCLFFDIGYRGNVFVPMIACMPLDFGILPREWMGREFDSIEAAQIAIENWYFNKTKQDANTTE